MKKLMVLLLLAVTSSVALADPPSDPSIRKLFEVTHVQSAMVTLRSTMEKSMRQGVDAAMANKNLSADQQKIVDSYTTQIYAIIDEQLTWDKVEPIYLQVYRENFTQDEVDAINAFYSTPAGHAVIEKMPATMLRVNQLMQPNLQVMSQKMQALLADLNSKASQAPPEPHGPASAQPQTP